MAETLEPGAHVGARECVNAVNADTSMIDEQTTTSMNQLTVRQSHRERNDDYRGVVMRLSARWRIIVCRDGLQWIIQRSDGERRGQRRWTGVHYCCTRQALFRIRRASEPRSDASALKAIANLPPSLRGLR